MIEGACNLVGSDASLVENQVDHSLWHYGLSFTSTSGLTAYWHYQFTLNLSYSLMILSLAALNYLIACSLIGSEMRLTNQLYHSLSLSLTCGRLLLIS